MKKTLKPLDVYVFKVKTGREDWRSEPAYLSHGLHLARHTAGDLCQIRGEGARVRIYKALDTGARVLVEEFRARKDMEPLRVKVTR